MEEEDTGQLQPVNMVEQQLVVAAHGTTEQQIAFERFILEETLYVATPDAQPERMVTLAQGTKLQLLNVKLHDDRLATAVFTAPQRAADARPRAYRHDPRTTGHPQSRA
jgi:hypothetical protein